MNQKIQKTTAKGILKRGDKILFVKDTKCVWELPGGKIDFGENPGMDPINHLAKHSKKPTLVIHGQKDTSVPLELSKILLTKNKTIKSLSFLAPENTSHSISTYEPTVIESLIKFIIR